MESIGKTNTLTHVILAADLDILDISISLLSLQEIEFGAKLGPRIAIKGYKRELFGNGEK